VLVSSDDDLLRSKTILNMNPNFMFVGDFTNDAESVTRGSIPDEGNVFNIQADEGHFNPKDFGNIRRHEFY
jgi:hypothetical protein